MLSVLIEIIILHRNKEQVFTIYIGHFDRLVMLHTHNHKENSLFIVRREVRRLEENLSFLGNEEEFRKKKKKTG